MAGSVNKVILVGNTGDNVKMHYFDGGNCIGRFPLATTEEYTNRDGDKVSNTEWHNIVVRNKAAEICDKYLGKGDKVYIEGRIKTRKWQDDKNNDRYSTEIQCINFTFLTPKGQSAASGESSNKVNEPQQENLSEDKEGEEDDLPF